LCDAILTSGVPRRSVANQDFPLPETGIEIRFWSATGMDSVRNPDRRRPRTPFRDPAGVRFNIANGLRDFNDVPAAKNQIRNRTKHTGKIRLIT
jgi:hypothetical protein